MSAEQVGPDRAAEEGRQVGFPLGYGLCAVYTLREKRKPLTPRPEGVAEEPAPWEDEVPDGLTAWEQAEIEYRRQR